MCVDLCVSKCNPCLPLRWLSLWQAGFFFQSVSANAAPDKYPETRPQATQSGSAPTLCPALADMESDNAGGERVQSLRKKLAEGQSKCNPCLPQHWLSLWQAGFFFQYPETRPQATQSGSAPALCPALADMESDNTERERARLPDGQVQRLRKKLAER
jgi:hypothetical protein